MAVPMQERQAGIVSLGGGTGMGEVESNDCDCETYGDFARPEVTHVPNASGLGGEIIFS